MNSRGHNENAVRLGILADDAKRGLERVAQGESDAIDGWLAYGAALNEGRSLFPGDREFGQWVETNVLSQVATAEITRDERAAAMWAAANADQFNEARAAGNARTVRGIHAKWKEIEAERLAEERRQKAEAERKEAEARAEAARKEVAAKVAFEADAREAARQAKDEAERAAAEARAADAAKARAAAVQKAAEAEAAAAIAPQSGPDPDAEARAALAGLTREGLVDEVIGLRAENADLREKLKAAAAEVKALKARLADHTADDKDDVIRRLQAQVRQAQNERFRAEEKFAAEKRKTYALQKRVSELESMEIPLN